MAAAKLIYNLQLTIYKKFSSVKFLLLFLTLSCLLITIPGVAHAQTPGQLTGDNPYQLSTSSFSPQNPNYASMAIYNFGHAISCILIGQSPMAPCLEYKMYKDASGMVRSVPYLSSVNTSNGVLGVTLSMVGEVISTPPIRSSLFLANLGEQVGIKSAHAQVGGSGSGVLAPIFKLWEVSRNISYLAMIIIFIIVGLMVMFRQKLNPQTVVSIQMALPGLVIGLVMITFSYFLASLISDLAFVGTNVVGYYFSLAQGTDKVTQLPLITSSTPGGNNPRPNTEDNVIGMFSRNTNIVTVSDIHDTLKNIWPYLEGKKRIDPKILALLGGHDGVVDYIANFDAQKALVSLATLLAVQFVLPFGSLFGGPGQFISGSLAAGTTLTAPIWVVSWSLAFVAMIILVYSMFKLLLRLIQSLLHIIFLTIAAPFYFLAVSLPGKQSLIPNWFFNMLCNVLVFPAVFAVFYFVAFILGSDQDPLFAVKEGTSLVGGSTFPLFGGLPIQFLNILIAFGALVTLPSIPDIICRAVGRPGQLGALAAGAVGGAIAAGQRYQGQAQSGSSGLVGNIGRLTNDPGYVVVNQGGGKFTFRRPSGPAETLAAGARPGQGTRAWLGISGFLGGGRRTPASGGGGGDDDKA